MYRLTPRMQQRFRGDLTKYHDLFKGNRCSGWETEELIVAAIKCDTQAQHHVRWQEAGHDDLADIVVKTNGTQYPIQIKSGKIGVKTKKLVLSGHRLGRFNEDLADISNYLNTPSANIIAVPHRMIDNEQGRQHIYRICYADKQILTGLSADKWKRKGAQWIQTNSHGVEFSLRPSMSWQIWWAIPVDLIEMTDEFSIN